MRGHWLVENALHWTLDVVFNDDQSRLRKGHGALNMAIVRHFALNLVRAASDKHSIKLRRKKGRVEHGLPRNPRRTPPLTWIRSPDKANEILAIPRLLDMLAIKGAVVTIDAMGCQRAIARKVLDKKADYIFALEGNQGTLREDVELFAAEQRASNFKDTTVSRARTVDGDHGRIESRDITVIHDIDWLQKNHQWPGLNSVVMVQSTRETGGKIERETRFYITSLVLIASLIGPSSEPIGRSRTASIGCSIWSSEMTNAACEPITLPQTSPQ